jgi:hypothetical protein
LQQFWGFYALVGFNAFRCGQYQKFHQISMGQEFTNEKANQLMALKKKFETQPFI